MEPVETIESDRPNPPNGLGASGLALWDRLQDAALFRADELVLVEEACRTADTLARLREIDDPDQKTTTEIRLQQEALRKLLRSVDWPEEAGSMRDWGRKMAQRRWHGA